jgi:hypothetical protein
MLSYIFNLRIYFDENIREKKNGRGWFWYFKSGNVLKKWKNSNLNE